MLSRLHEHEEFAKVLFLMHAYLDNSLETGSMARNEMIDFMTDMADEWSMSRPKKAGSSAGHAPTECTETLHA
ncbi:MAG: hypothetical protein IJ418_16825 [Clostridia bacterium]|nr:hypothetical protein [Clostridia bacterium]